MMAITAASLVDNMIYEATLKYSTLSRAYDLVHAA